MARRLGRYELHELLGEGGMGAVWRARDLLLEREVALKLLRGGALSAEDLGRFRREARAAARLRHPGIVGVHTLGVEGGHPYLVFDLVRGESLAERLRREGPMRPRDAARLVADLAEALDYAHQRGVLHRDLKPANVLLDAGGAPLLSDFGLARLEGADDHSRYTRSGDVLGTPAYMAPEQVRGDPGRIGPAADVYGLGGVLYHALAGRAPFAGSSAWEAMARVVSEPPPAPRAFQAGLDPDLEAICLRCLEKDPERRYRSAADLARALRGWLDGVRAPAGAARLGPGRPLLAALALLGLLDLSLALAWLALRGAPPPPAPVPSEVPTPETGRSPEPPIEREGEPSTQPARPDSPAGEAARLAEEGSRARRRGDLVRARQLFEQALAVDPDSVPALIWRGLLRSEQGDMAGAEADFARALELEPDRAQTLEMRGFSRGARGLQAEALIDLRRAVELEPDRAGAWSVLGLTLGQLGRREEALAALDRALRLEPGMIEALGNRAELRRTTGDLQGALDDLARVMAAAPRDPHHLLCRSQVYDALGRAEESRRDLEAALAAGPDEPDVWDELATRLCDSGRPDEALRRLDEAGPPVARSPGLLATRGGLLARAGRLAEARADLDRALALDPNQVRARFNRATLSLTEGDAAAALEDVDACLERQPDVPNYHALRGQACWQMERLPESLASFLRAVELGPSQESWTNVAAVQLALGDYASAVRSIQGALEYAPEDVHLLGLLGRTQGQVLDYAGAVATFQRGLRVEPDHPELLAGYGLCLASLGRHEEARPVFDRALQLLPPGHAARAEIARALARR